MHCHEDDFFLLKLGFFKPEERNFYTHSSETLFKFCYVIKKVTFYLELYLTNSSSVAKSSCASKRVTAPVKPDDLRICEHSPEVPTAQFARAHTQWAFITCFSATTFQSISFQVSRGFGLTEHSNRQSRTAELTRLWLVEILSCTS